MTTQSTGELLAQGLLLAGAGLVLVFAGLLLLWGLTALLARAGGRRSGEKPAPSPAPGTAASHAAPAEPAADPRLTAERARVAAVVAASLVANALPLVFDVPLGPAFEHGRTAPLWVTANRARVLQSWQPHRLQEDRVEY